MPLFRSVQWTSVRRVRRSDLRDRGVRLSDFFTGRFPAGYRLLLEALPDRWLPTDKGVPAAMRSSPRKRARALALASAMVALAGAVVAPPPALGADIACSVTYTSN